MLKSETTLEPLAIAKTSEYDLELPQSQISEQNDTMKKRHIRQTPTRQQEYKSNKVTSLLFLT